MNKSFKTIAFLLTLCYSGHTICMESKYSKRNRHLNPVFTILDGIKANETHPEYIHEEGGKYWFGKQEVNEETWKKTRAIQAYLYPKTIPESMNNSSMLSESLLEMVNVQATLDLTQLNKLWFVAIEKGSTKRVKSLIKNTKVDINVKDENGLTALNHVYNALDMGDTTLHRLANILIVNGATQSILRKKAYRIRNCIRNLESFNLNENLLFERVKQSYLKLFKEELGITLAEFNTVHKRIIRPEGPVFVTLLCHLTPINRS